MSLLGILIIAVFSIYYLGWTSLFIALFFILIAASIVDNRYILPILIALVVLLPKFSLLQVPDTYISIRIEDVYVLLISMGVIAHMLISKKAFKLPKLALPIAIFIIVTFISLMAGFYQGTISSVLLGWLFFLRRIEYFILFAIAYWTFDQGNMPTIRNVLLITVFATAIVAILQLFGIVGAYSAGSYVQNSEISRVFSVFNGPYEYSTYLAMMFPIFLAIYLKKYSAINYLIMIIMLYMVMLTASRTAIFSVFAAGMAFSFIEKGRKGILPIMIAITIVAFFLMPDLTRGRFIDLPKEGNVPMVMAISADPNNVSSHSMNPELSETEQQNVDMSLIIRYIRWSVVYRSFLEHPLFGLGPSAFGEAVDGNYIRILGENGIFGLLAFAWIMGGMLSIFIGNYRKNYDNRALNEFSLFMLMSLIILLMNAVFHDAFEASKIAMLFWALTGILFKISASNEQVIQHGT